MELVKVKFKGGWALADPVDIGNGKYEPYVEPAEAEKPVAPVEAVTEVKADPPVEVKKDVSNSRGRNRR